MTYVKELEEPVGKGYPHVRIEAPEARDPLRDAGEADR